MCCLAVNGQYLFVEWLFRREFVRGPRMIVLLGREMASIYLWNDSFGRSSLEDHEWLCYWAMKWPVFICGMSLSAGVRQRTTNDCIIGPWNGQYLFVEWLFRREFVRGPRMIVLLGSVNICFKSRWFSRREFVREPRIFVWLGREMASICLWNDFYGRSSLEDYEWLCYGAVKWPVFYCLFVKWLFRREFVRGLRFVVLLGREMASICLRNDSFRAYCTLRNEMKRNEMKICTLRNWKSVLCEMENLYFAKWKICTLRNGKTVLCEMKNRLYAPSAAISFRKRTLAYCAGKYSNIIAK